MHSDRTEAGVYQLIWIDHDSESLPELRKSLAREFGDAMADLIYIRGNLHRFYEPVLGWKERGENEIDLKITKRSGGGLSFNLSNGEWNSSVAYTEKTTPIKAFPRLDHLFDYSAEAETLFDSNKDSGYLVGESIPGKPGLAISPHSGSIIDIQGFPPGALVQDPTFPSADKKYFRVPEPTQ